MKHSKEEYKWYYQSLVKIYKERRNDLVAARMFNEFIEMVEKVFGKIEN